MPVSYTVRTLLNIYIATEPPALSMKGVKSLVQGDIPGSMSEVRTLNLIFVTHTLSSVS
jgi:hypothetical protein